MNLDKLKIFTNTKTLNDFIPKYFCYPADADYLILGSRKVDISLFKNLKGIFRCGVGIDNLPATKIPIAFPSDNTKTIIYQEVACFTCSLIFRMFYGNVGTIKPWTKTERDRIHDKILLVIGNGNTGMRVTKIMSNICKVITFDIDTSEPLESLVKRSDIISLHLPSNLETYEILKPKWMKPNVKLVNTARAKLTNEQELFLFLSSNKNSMAAFDVFWKEPYDGKLLSLDNFYASPHVASTCRQFKEAIFGDFVKFVKGTSLGASD